jgi:type II secretory pathway pseudopilin PulG
MRRGCVITIIFLAVIALVLSVLFWVFKWPQVQASETAKFAYLIEDSLEQYRADQQSYPAATTNSGVVEALYGENPREKHYMTGMGALIRDGQFTDYWKNPLRIVFPSGETEKIARVISAGPNGEFGDSDDITSQSIRDEIATRSNQPEG